MRQDTWGRGGRHGGLLPIEEGKWFGRTISVLIPTRRAARLGARTRNGLFKNGEIELGTRFLGIFRAQRALRARRRKRAIANLRAALDTARMIMRLSLNIFKERR